MQIGISFNPGTHKKQRDIKDGGFAGVPSEVSGPSLHFRGGVSPANALMELLMRPTSDAVLSFLDVRTGLK